MIIEALGTIVLKIQKNEPGEPSAILGYTIIAAAWGKGIATEACRKMIDFGFGELGIQEITASTVPENLGSTRVLEKCGMTKVGLEAAALKVDGKNFDEAQYSIHRKHATSAKIH
jgi:ribosomal-protein-alanine N-acetyltransferase